MTKADQIDLALGRDEALVLFEMLAEFQLQPAIEIKDSAERLALIRLCGALERVLVEPFAADYRAIVDEARLRLAGELAATTNEPDRVARKALKVAGNERLSGASLAALAQDDGAEERSPMKADPAPSAKDDKRRRS